MSYYIDSTDSTTIHPYCGIHYEDALVLPKVIYMIETFCPDFAATWDSVKSGDDRSWEEFKEILTDLAADGRSIEEQLNWSEKNGY